MNLKILCVLGLFALLCFLILSLSKPKKKNCFEYYTNLKNKTINKLARQTIDYHKFIQSKKNKIKAKTIVPKIVLHKNQTLEQSSNIDFDNISPKSMLDGNSHKFYTLMKNAIVHLVDFTIQQNPLKNHDLIKNIPSIFSLEKIKYLQTNKNDPIYKILAENGYISHLLLLKGLEIYTEKFKIKTVKNLRAFMYYIFANIPEDYNINLYERNILKYIEQLNETLH